jgi:hypothetical protein
VRYLFFSECLQNDFVAPMKAGAPLPNELLIGRAESRRLLGDPDTEWEEEGPLARFLFAFQAGASREHASVHIRDWHDPDDSATRAHSLSFVESDERQKRLALASTCRLAHQLLEAGL